MLVSQRKHKVSHRFFLRHRLALHLRIQLHLREVVQAGVTMEALLLVLEARVEAEVAVVAALLLNLEVQEIHLPQALHKDMPEVTV